MTNDTFSGSIQNFNAIAISIIDEEKDEILIRRNIRR